MADLDVVRRQTDRSVLEALLTEHLTRAELASNVGISRPTASESVRRLSEAGLVVEAGRQSGGRGRAGTYCRVADDVAAALSIHAGPGGVRGELVGADGLVDHQASSPLGMSATVAELRSALGAVIDELEGAFGRRVAMRTISIAHTVDVRRREVVHLEGSPFLTDGGSIAEVAGRWSEIDNDVQWAASAETEARHSAGLPADHFFYVYLGSGLGAAIVDDRRLVGGHRGLAGELSHVLVSSDGSGHPHGPGGTRLGEALGALARSDAAARATLGALASATSGDAPTTSQAVGGGSAGGAAGTAGGAPTSTALDVDQMRRLTHDAESARAVGDLLGKALASVIALVDPEVIVLGGPWAPSRREQSAYLLEAVQRAIATYAPYPVPVEAALLGEDAPLLGARRRAAHLATQALLDLV